jgi:hypothetical protein
VAVGSHVTVGSHVVVGSHVPFQLQCKYFNGGAEENLKINWLNIDL